MSKFLLLLLTLSVSSSRLFVSVFDNQTLTAEVGDHFARLNPVNNSLWKRYFESVVLAEYTCPDPSVQVIAFAPNPIDIEQKVTLSVANQSIINGFNTVTLLVENATRLNFLNYASCPNLVALFYDGDANNEIITAFDDVISYKDIELLNWNYNVTSYWLACQAFNAPMLDAMTKVRPRRWAAGRSDLAVGTSDLAASQAMNMALNGKCLTESFDYSVKQQDMIPTDIWGYGGYGPNILVDSLYPIPCGGFEKLNG